MDLRFKVCGFNGVEMMWLMTAVILTALDNVVALSSLPSNCFIVPSHKKSNTLNQQFNDVPIFNINESPTTSGKNPMMLLNEVAMFNRARHDYMVISEEGPPHNRRFTVMLKLLRGHEVVSEHRGFGKSIKKAQHDAAAAALRDSPLPHPPKRSKRSHQKTNDDFLNDSAHPTMIINTLSQRAKSPAVYTVEESGPAHAKMFRTICDFQGFRTEGLGSSKKISKENAAQSMVQMIKQSNFAAPIPVKKRKRRNKTKKKGAIPRDFSYFNSKSKVMELLKGGRVESFMSDANIPSNDDSISQRSDDEYYSSYETDSLPKTLHKKLGNLKLSQTDNLPSGYDELDKFAKSSNYDVKVSNVKTNDGNHMSVLEMKSLSPKHSDVICFGEDGIMNKAQELSVQGALNYLSSLENGNMNLSSNSYSSINHWMRKIQGAFKHLKSLTISKDTLIRYGKYASILDHTEL